MTDQAATLRHLMQERALESPVEFGISMIHPEQKEQWSKEIVTVLRELGKNTRFGTQGWSLSERAESLWIVPVEATLKDVHLVYLHLKAMEIRSKVQRATVWVYQEDTDLMIFQDFASRLNQLCARFLTMNILVAGPFRKKFSVSETSYSGSSQNLLTLESEDLLFRFMFERDQQMNDSGRGVRPWRSLLQNQSQEHK
jgi:hypothetical protein